MYIFSLLLYHSCVLCVSEFFQQACKSLDEKHQPIVLQFFASLKENKEPITKEVLRKAIALAVPSSPHLRFIASSPLRTPDKPTWTPSKTFSHEQLKELHKTKMMLDHERYERNILEVEVKQNEEQIDLLRKHQQFHMIPLLNSIYFSV